MKTFMAILLTAALLPATSFAQGHGHAYGHFKHEERFEVARPAPVVRVYTAPVYTPPRVYYVRPRYVPPRPSISLSFPFGYSTYQPYGTYYYPNGYVAPQRVRVIRQRREREDQEHRFAHERHER